MGDKTSDRSGAGGQGAEGAARAALRGATGRSDHVQGAGSRRSVLLVDDEPRILESLRIALSDVYDVETCVRSVDALAQLEAEPHRYDVVLCDLSMPEIDGVTFFEQMQNLGVGDRFIVMTGGAFSDRAVEFLSRGACPSIDKPFLLTQLRALIDAVSSSRRAS